MAFINSHKHKFQLEQLTPILHFQPEQDGAAVRASEMKPKLDRFILEYCGDDVSKEVMEEWIQASSEENSNKLPSLAYKMNIYTGEKEFPWEGRDRYPGGFFGNVRTPGRNIGVLGILSQDVEVEITCYSDSLLDKIKEVFPVFLAVTNFGTRQRMGYGSFRLKGEEWNREELIRKYAERMTENKVLVYSFQCPGENTDADVALDMIKDFHQHLKSGVRSRDYDANCSLLLKQYAAEKDDNSVNEKKAMKAALARAEVYNIEKLSRQRNGEETLRRVPLRSVVYKRGIFGFAGQYEFRSVYRKTERRNINEQGCTVIFQLKAKSEKGTIKRFPSPITYSAEQGKIYMIVRLDHINQLLDYDPHIMLINQKEKIKLRGPGRPDVKNGAAKPIHMNLPKNFDVKDFFEFVAEKQVPCCIKVDGEPVEGYYQLRTL